MSVARVDSSSTTVPSTNLRPEFQLEKHPQLEGFLDSQVSDNSHSITSRSADAKDLNTSDFASEGNYEKTRTVAELRAALRKHDQPATGRKCALANRWKEFCEHTTLLHRCEQKLPDRADRTADRYFAKFKWASKDKEKAVGPLECARLQAEIEKLRDYRRKLHAGYHLKRQQADAMLLCMRKKLPEGRKTLCRRKVNKAKSAKARASKEPEETQK